MMKACAILAIVSLVTLAAVAGCRRETLRTDEVAGVWHIDEQDGVGSKIAGTASVNLDASGNFVAHSLSSEFVRIDGMKLGQEISGTGTWSIIHIDDQDRVQLGFTNIEGYNGHQLPYGAEFFVAKSHSKVRLLYFEGDPDEDRIVFFRRM